MENPHEAEQAVLLERIIKNVVSVEYPHLQHHGSPAGQVQ